MNYRSSIDGFSRLHNLDFFYHQSFFGFERQITLISCDLLVYVVGKSCWLRVIRNMACEYDHADGGSHDLGNFAANNPTHSI